MQQKRLYFLVPDIDTAHRVVEKLLLARISEDQMYVVARHDADTRELPDAGIAQTSDIAGSAQRGAAAGAATGVVAGLTALVFPPAGLAVGGGMVAATGLTGAGVGAWMSSMIGIRNDNSKLTGYREAIDAGQVLMMVDVDHDRVDGIQTRIKDNYPDVAIEGTDPHKPVFP